MSEQKNTFDSLNELLLKYYFKNNIESEYLRSHSAMYHTIKRILFLMKNDVVKLNCSNLVNKMQIFLDALQDNSKETIYILQC